MEAGRLSERRHARKGSTPGDVDSNGSLAENLFAADLMRSIYTLNQIPNIICTRVAVPAMRAEDEKLPKKRQWKDMAYIQHILYRQEVQTFFCLAVGIMRYRNLGRQSDNAI